MGIFFLIFLSFFGFSLQAGGKSFFDHLTPSYLPNGGVALITAFGVTFLLALLGFRLGWYRLKPHELSDEDLTLRKGFFSSLFDFLLGGVFQIVLQIVPEKFAKSVFSFVACFFLFVLSCNGLGLIPGFGLATSDINLNLALGTLSFLLFNYYGFRYSGLNYVKHLMGPVWVMSFIIFPVEVISLFLRPFTLGMRLTGVMSGDHLMVDIFERLLASWKIPFLPLPALLKGLGLVISIVQAYVFTILSVVYVKLSLPESHS